MCSLYHRTIRRVILDSSANIMHASNSNPAIIFGPYLSAFIIERSRSYMFNSSIIMFDTFISQLILLLDIFEFLVAVKYFVSTRYTHYPH